MARKEKPAREAAAEKVGEMLRAFGNTVGEILDDPEVKEKAKGFAQSVVDAAAKVVESKIEDKQVKAKFRNVGKAAKSLGESLEVHFKA